MSDTLTKALIFVLALDLVLFLGQISINYVATEMNLPAPFFYNTQSDLLSQAGDYYTLDTTNIEGRLYSSTPVAQQSTSSGWFSDAVKDLKTWFVDNIPGLNYLIGIVAAPASYLAVIGAPAEVTYSIGGFWLILTIFLIVGFITGRNN